MSTMFLMSRLDPSASFMIHSKNDLHSLLPSLTTTTSSSSSSTYHASSLTSLSMISQGRSSPLSSYNNDRSKRQERVGHVVRTEIASIVQLGYPIKNQMGDIDDELRRRINVVNADVSPDLRQARITVSVMKRNNRNRVTQEEEDEEDDDEEYEDEEYEYDDDEEYEEEEEYDYDEEDVKLKQVFPVSSSSRNGDSIVDRRRSYAWLVRNTKQIRHALSQRLSHMKTIPNLTFVLADVGAAVDVMNLIDKVSKGNYKRDDIGLFGGDDNQLPKGMYLESEIDDYDDEYEWIDDEEDEDDWVDAEEEEQQ